MPKYLAPINLTQNELQNARIQNLGADPGSPVTGQIWFNTGTNILKIYNGTAAVDFLTTGAATTALALKANLASPTFTGTVTVPTATAGDSTTAAASTAFVTGGISTAVSTKANLASPTFTGTPLSTTAAVDTNTTQIATTAFVIGQAYAKLASPTFTGTPVAPTAAGATNTTQIATTAFVRGEISTLVGGAGAALDTLNELAAALGNDASFSTTVTTNLALKAPLASPALTGTPTAPTATGGTNTTQIATTAFVQAAVSSAGAALRYSADYGDGTTTSFVITHGLATRDVHVMVRETSGSYNAVLPDVQMTSTGTVTLIHSVAPTAGQYRVTILG